MRIKKLQFDLIKSMMHSIKTPYDLPKNPASFENFMTIACSVIERIGINPKMLVGFLEMTEKRCKFPSGWAETCLDNLLSEDGSADGAKLAPVFVIHECLKNPVHRNYLVASEFYQDLKDISLENLRFQDIAYDGTFYLNTQGVSILPASSQDIYCNLYCTVGPKPPDLDVFDEYRNCDKALSFIINSQKGDTTYCSSLPIPNDGTIPIQDWLDHESRHKNRYKAETQQRIKEVCKLIAYIHSGDPDIREFRNDIQYQSPQSQTPIKKDKELQQGIIQVVGYNWKKETERRTGCWSVREHFRWQRYGPKLSKVKLALIESYLKGPDREQILIAEGTV